MTTLRALPPAVLVAVASLLLCTSEPDAPRVIATVSIAADTVRAAENAGYVEIGIELSGALDEPTGVEYVAQQLTAVKGVDFDLTDGFVTFEPGDVYKTLAVTLVDDSIIDGSETFQVSITGVVLGTAVTGRRTTCTCVISDDTGDVVVAAAVPYLTRIGALTERVEALRGLSFVRPPRVAVLTREEYGALVASDVSSGMNDAVQRGLTAEYVQMLCMEEDTTSLDSVIIDYHTNFPIAYHIRGTDSLYFITGETDDTLVNMILVHELTHLLTEQNLGINDPILPRFSYFNSDGDRALRTVREGDASFVEYLYLVADYYGDPDPIEGLRPYCMKWRTEFLQRKYDADEPYYLDILSNAPYEIGMGYVAALCSTSADWDKVGEAQISGSAPLSMMTPITDAAMTPDYFEFSRIQDLLAAANPGADFLDDDNGGPVLLLGIFWAYAGTLDHTAGCGYAGDRYVFVLPRGETWGTLVWALGFTTAAHADSVCEALRSGLSTRAIAGAIPTIQTVVDSSDTLRYTITYPGFTSVLEKNGTTVVLVDNGGSLTGQLRGLALQSRMPALAKRSVTPRTAADFATAATEKQRLTSARQWRAERLLAGRLRDRARGL